jgi:hypothetical protein
VKIFKFVVLRIVPLKTVLFLMVAALPATCAFAQKGGFEFAGGGGAAYFPSQYNSTPGSKGVSAHASLSYNIWNDLSAGFEYGYTDGGVQTNSTSGTYGGTSSTAAKYNSYRSTPGASASSSSSAAAA